MFMRLLLMTICVIHLSFLAPDTNGHDLTHNRDCLLMTCLFFTLPA